MTVDLARQVIEGPGMGLIPFQIDSRRRVNLLRGSDYSRSGTSGPWQSSNEWPAR